MSGNEKRFGRGKRLIQAFNSDTSSQGSSLSGQTLSTFSNSFQDQKGFLLFLHRNEYRFSMDQTKPQMEFDSTYTPGENKKYGEEIPLKCNFIPLEFQESQIHIYAVSFSLDIGSTSLKHKILMEHREHLGDCMVFDGNVIYSKEMLPTQEIVFKSTLPHSNSNQLVDCKITYCKSSSISECLALLNIVFRKVLRILNLKLVGRNYYNVEMGIPVPKYGLHIWPGYVTSIRPYDGGVMLVIDVAHRILRMDTAYSWMSQIYQQSKGQNFQQLVMKELIGKSVITRYNNKTYKIDDIDWSKTPRDTFKWNDKKDISYRDVWKTNYGFGSATFNSPIKNFIKKDPHKTNSKPEEENLVCLIPEFCHMTGLDENHRSNFQLMKEISQYIHSGPRERYRSVQKFLEVLNSTDKAQELLSQWGIKISNSPLKLVGKRMPTEKLICQNGSQQFPVDPAAGWIGKITKSQLLNAVSLDNWLCICTTRDKVHVGKFINMVISQGNQMGMRIVPPAFHEVPNDRIENFINKAKSSMNGNTKLIMAVFPTQRDDRYAAFKRMCCCDNPIPSQVILTRTISNPRKVNSVAQRVAMQINCKLGGELWTVEIPVKNMMAIGIDVNHSSNAGRRVSVVGFVSSLNSSMSRWYTSVAFQTPGEEMVNCVRLCLLKALQKYVEFNNSLPEKIMVFRDGVSKGQYTALHNIELNCFLKTFEEFRPGFNPQFIFLVIKKRIKSRIYGMDDESNCEYSNPKPGTLVDHTIIDGGIAEKKQDNFLLVSQHFNQGTVQPTCFCVFYNSSNLKTHQLQILTYKFTYLYYNWPGTVRVPAPCQYAHRAAFLTGQSLQKEASAKLADKLYYL